MTAPNVATSATLPIQTTFRAHLCPAGGAPCDMAEHLGSGLAPALELVADHLPCDSCRAGAARARDLARLRLGERERWILLHAPGPEGEDGLLLDARTRPGRESLLRAARRLHAAGLVYVGALRERRERRVPWRIRAGLRPATFDVYRRAAWRTPLGESLVRLRGHQLGAGARIRWTPRLMAEITAATHDRLEARLGRLAASLRPARDRASELLPPLAIGAAAGGKGAHEEGPALGASSGRLHGDPRHARAARWRGRDCARSRLLRTGGSGRGGCR